MEKIVHLHINNIPVEAKEGMTILEAAKLAGIHIPTLCYLKDVTKEGACRVCQVEVEGARTLCAACVYPVSEGMKVYTHTKRVLDARRSVVELIISNHSKDCLSCIRNTNCELQRLSQELGVRENAYAGDKTPATFDEVSPGIVRNTAKCILCGRCVEACKKFQGIGVLGFMDRGFKTKVGPVYDKSFAHVNCIQCGQCINVCPVGALTEKEEIHDVVNALNDPNTHVVVQTAPAVRAALGEEFKLPIGTGVTGKMVTALKILGFDKVYDTNFGADLTIMEEGYEFIDRVQNGGKLPMITSCSPGWINYVEKEYPDLLDNLSTCKSPQMMVGAIIKSYYAKVKNIDPKNIYVVSIMPCVAKKGEKERHQMIKDGMKDVDSVLTTRELAKLIKMFGLDFKSLPDSEFDQDLFGEYSGAGVIFGASGGVMEAALRTCADVLAGEDLDNFQYHKVRGTEGLKTCTLNIGGTIIKVAVAHSMKVAKPLLEEIRKGESPYHFIEIMGCPGGCINGGGQPYVRAFKRNQGIDFKKLRAEVLYEEDRNKENRKSHKNEQIQKLYADFLVAPNSTIAHELLHTHYNKQDKFIFEDEE